jgi:hypothetical protein
VSHIVTLTGAFKNAGDYLIGDRARKLLAAHTDAKIVDINRRELADHHYDVLNSARAVLLTGGPAYQAAIYPNVYNLDLDRVSSPVVPYGLGWKGKLGQDPADFRFEPAAGDFVRNIHADKTRFSSARDFLTIEMLRANGVENAAMTGCPAWYDENQLAHEYEFDPNVKTLVLSMPAVPQPLIPVLIHDLARRFPKANRFLSFQAGYKSTHSKKSAEYSRWNYLMLARGVLSGFKPISFESDFAGFESFMGGIDLHVGFRVHSHIFSLSQRKTSLLIAEDSRGLGQVAAMGGEALAASAKPQDAVAAIERLFDTRGESVTQAVETMRATHPEMLRFLSQL